MFARSKPSIQLLDIIGRSSKANDEGLASRVIGGLVGEIKMTRLGKLAISKYRGNITCLQPLRESHIALYIRRSGWIVVSIVSCRYFDENKALDYASSELELSDITINSYKI